MSNNSGASATRMSLPVFETKFEPEVLEGVESMKADPEAPFANVKVMAEGDKSNATTVDMDTIRAYIKQLNEIEVEQKALRRKKKELVDDFSDTYGIPKKSIAAAVRLLKSQADLDEVSVIYANIADLVDVE